VDEPGRTQYENDSSGGSRSQEPRRARRAWPRPVKRNGQEARESNPLSRPGPELGAKNWAPAPRTQEHSREKSNGAEKTRESPNLDVVKQKRKTTKMWNGRILLAMIQRLRKGTVA